MPAPRFAMPATRRPPIVLLGRPRSLRLSDTASIRPDRSASTPSTEIAARLTPAISSCSTAVSSALAVGKTPTTSRAA